jgi:RNA polymerase sigma factor (sigma-70 family)
MNYDEASNEELIMQARKGDTEALSYLFKKNTGLIHKVAYHYKNNGIFEYEDIVSIAKVGMLKAYEKFDLSFGFVFVTLAVRCMDSEIRKALRAYKATKRTGVVLSLDCDIRGEDSDLGTLGDIIPDTNPNPDEVCEHNAELELLKQSYSFLTDREKKIIYWAFYKEKTQRDIGNYLGISQVQVSRIYSKAIKKMKEHFNECGVSC